MKQKRRQRDPWEGVEFIDINTRPGEAPPRQEAPRPRRASPPGPSARGRPSREPPRPRRPRAPQERPRARKPMGKGSRRFLLVFTLLCMAAVTAFLCVFLLFKVRAIQVTGDLVYDEATVLDICGYELGDNLALLTTGSQEQALEDQLPYVQEAQILRHFPSGLEIHLTAARDAACVENGGQWFTVSYEGKLLEELSAPKEGVMQVTGLALQDPAPGRELQAQDEGVQAAFEAILAELADWDAAGDFTALDLSDLYNITMNYQGRVVFQLGSTVELAYKVDFGLRTVTNPEKIDSDAAGTLNLTVAPESKKSFFTAASPGTQATPAPGGDEGSSGGENAGGGTADGTDGTGDGDSDGDASQEGDRGAGIPDTIFTG